MRQGLALPLLWGLFFGSMQLCALGEVGRPLVTPGTLLLSLLMSLYLYAIAAALKEAREDGLM